MNAADIAAYIGAAAWLPQIGSWIHGYFVTPLITILPGAEAEVGFTTYGPIFNARMAISADRKDAIIDGFEIVIRHSDGEARTLRWAGLNETFSEIRDNAGNRQVVSRDQMPIAEKINTQSLFERFIRFQEPRYHDSVRPLMNNLVAQFNFLKQSGDPDYVEKVLSSKELYELHDTRKAAFWWKPGRYTLDFNLSATTRVSVARRPCSFELTSVDVGHLHSNLTIIETDLRNIIKSNLPDFQIEPINWNWANVSLQKRAN